MTFVGRARELDELQSALDRVVAGGSGRAIVLRGRRRVGKSLLAETFVGRAGLPSVYVTATAGAAPAVQRDELVRAVVESDLPERDAASDARADTWLAALRLLAAAVPSDAPSIVVLDEVPYYAGADPSFEGALQSVWDRTLSRLPVLLLLIGSDLSVMEQLGSYGRPFHQRGTEMVLGPLTPRDVGEITGTSAADCFDAWLVTGGLPIICGEWSAGQSTQDFLRTSLARSTSALVVSGARILAAELPVEAQARTVLESIGSGERTFTAVAARAGGLGGTSLTRALSLLQDKRVVAAATPYSTRGGEKDRRYSVSDPYLRFFLRFVLPRLDEVDRGRGDLVVDRIGRDWTSWRGRAVEPVVREALERLLPDERFPTVRYVGGWWNRQNNPEVDLVGGDDRRPEQIGFVGSVKWRERAPFDGGDFTSLVRAAQAVPGASVATPLVCVSRSGVSTGGLTASWSPEDLLEAWPG